MMKQRLIGPALAAGALLISAGAQAGVKIDEALLKSLTVDDEGLLVEDIVKIQDIKTQGGMIHWIATVEDGQYSCDIKEADIKKVAATCKYKEDAGVNYI